jgi:Flp pilus assembly protein TadD
MRKMKQIIFLASFSFLANGLFAQSIDDGKRFLNYEKYTSAKDVFSKLLAANANNVEAAYWLGQTYLQNTDNTDTAGAKALYQKTLQANPNAPLMLVGNAEIALMEGKKEDARNGFETAISLSKGKDASVFIAVGRANVDVKDGDATYAIDKLNQAAAKDKKNAEIQIVLGDAYRKMIDGANATIAYQNAMPLDPKNARPSFMIGRIYETQGYGQEAVYMKYYNEAIAIDPKFAPVYYWLYNYYYRRDVNKSRDYLDKYIAVADPDSKNCYAQASILYASQKYQEAITKSDECITQAGATKPYPNLYGLKAYSYDKLGDSAKAKQYFEEFFGKIDTAKIGPNDYATYAKILLKFPGSDSLAAIYVDKAAAADTVLANKLDYLKAAAESLAAAQKFAAAGTFYTKILALKPTYGARDLYFAGYNDLVGGNYTAADSIFKLYQTKFPGDILGWYLGAKANTGLDTTGANGLAKPFYEKVIAIADTSADKERVKSNLITSYKYMLAYYYNIKHDKVAAIEWNNKILALDPTDAQAIANDKALNAPTKVRTETTKEKTTPTRTKVKSK